MINMFTIIFHAFLLFGAHSFAFDEIDTQDSEFSYDDQSSVANFKPAYSGAVNVMKTDGTDVDCRPIADSTYYKCSDNSFFQPSNPYAKMLKKDANDQLVIDGVQSIVSSEGDILFNNRSFGHFFDEAHAENSADSLAAKFENLSNLKYSLVFADIDDKQFSELRKIVDRQFDKVLKKFDTEKLNVTLKNGVKLQCKKAFKDKKLSSEQEKMPEVFAPMGKCGVFDCQKPGQKPGEKTRLYFESSPNPSIYPEIIDFKDGKIKGFPEFAKISHPSGDHLSEAAILSQIESPELAGLPKDIFVSDLFPEMENELNRLTHPHYFNGPEYLEEACQDSDQLLTKQKEEVDKRIKEFELAQVFMFLNNDMVSLYIDPNKAREHFCFENGSFYTEEAYKNKNLNFQESGRRKILSQDEVKDLFEQAKAMKDIAFGYKPDGCYARAHLMARRFEEKGYFVEKAWVNGDLKIDSEQPINWSYHVAPTVYAYDENGAVQRMIIDPSVSDQPITANAWAEMMTEHIEHNIQPTRFPFPINSAQYKRASMTFSNTDAYYPSENIKMTEEQKMKAAYDTMASYLPLQNADGGPF